MDNTSLNEQDTSGTPILLNSQSIGYLKEMRRWTKFLSIMGFIGTGLIIILALSLGSLMNLIQSMSPTPFPFPTFFITIVYLIFAVLYFFPSLYLYRFSEKMEVALAQRDEGFLAQSFGNLKSVFKFMGILTIVVLSFYVLAIVLGILAALFMQH